MCFRRNTSHSKREKTAVTINPATDGYLPYVDIKAFEKGIVDNYASTEKSLLCDEGDLLIHAVDASQKCGCSAFYGGANGVIA